jgi:hypothetical protein
MNRLCVAVVLGSGLALSACSGSGMPTAVPVSFPAAASMPDTPMSETPTLKPVVSPASLNFFETGVSAARTIAVRERANTGNYTLSEGCKAVAKFARVEKKKGVTRYSVTPVHPGLCRVRLSDTSRHAVTVPISVTATSIQLASSSVSSRAMSATVTNGSAIAISALTTCAQGCSIAAPPSKPGAVAYTVATYTGANGTGKILATGVADATIVGARQNLASAVLLGVPATAAFGTLPAATSGVPFATSPLSLAVSDAAGDAISGTFATPIVVTDADTSSIAQGSYLSLNSASPSRSVSLRQGSDTLALGYGGLAIPAAALAASIASSVIGQTQFAPAVSSVAYTGPRDSEQLPEIDLYDTNAGQPGYASSFALSQTGWSASPYTRPFSFVATGTNNNCSSFVVTPSGAAAYTVHPVASPEPGLCTMMLTGGSSASSTPLILTYTIPTPIHVSAIGVRP